VRKVEYVVVTGAEELWPSPLAMFVKVTVMLIGLSRSVS